MKSKLTAGGQGHSSAIVRVASDCLTEQLERIQIPPSFYREHPPQRSQIQIVCSQIRRRPPHRTNDLGSLQCGLDDPRDRSRNLVLQVEDVFERAVEAVRPEMCT